jgi:hypothetical protein
LRPTGHLQPHRATGLRPHTPFWPTRTRSSTWTPATATGTRSD